MGGRHFDTCMACLILETYYRSKPAYASPGAAKEKDAGPPAGQAACAPCETREGGRSSQVAALRRHLPSPSLAIARFPSGSPFLRCLSPAPRDWEAVFQHPLSGVKGQ